MELTGVLGRASIGNPWFLISQAFFKNRKQLAMPSLEERVKVVKEHLDFSIRWRERR